MPHLQKEIALLEQGYRFVAGLDEAGRGAWAGPVVAAAVILPLEEPDLQDRLAELKDSKQLSPARREQLFAQIHATAQAVGVGLATAAQVDTLNVVGATRFAMRQALTSLVINPNALLLDHIRLPQINILQDAFPKADNISLSVAAASVIAKVTRDRLMVDLHEEYPHYGFDRHKGYGTRQHRQALQTFGPVSIHRMSFGPLRPWQNTLFD
jgi:ribonuclease HII